MSCFRCKNKCDEVSSWPKTPNGIGQTTLKQEKPVQLKNGNTSHEIHEQALCAEVWDEFHEPKLPGLCANVRELIDGVLRVFR